MHTKIRENIEHLFRSAPRNARAIELKEELIANLTERYTDLVQQGETEEAAYAIAMAGIGDVNELIQGLREEQAWDPAGIQEHRNRSALLVSVSVGLFIVSVAFPLSMQYITARTGNTLFLALGTALMFLCIAVGVGILVYNHQTKPKYVKMEETIVEDFKEWTARKGSADNLQKTVQAVIWTSVVPLYLILGVFFNAWHPGWLIFLLAPAVSQVARLLFLYRQGE